MKKWQSISLVIGASAFGIGIITTTAIIAERLRLDGIESGGNDSLKIIDVAMEPGGGTIVFLANHECFWGDTHYPENKENWNSNKMLCYSIYNSSHNLYFTLDGSFKTYKLAYMGGQP